MRKKSVWLTYDLGIGGDYPSLYRWLANNKAIECGDSMAYLTHYVTNDNELIPWLKTELSSHVYIDNKTRIYCIRKEEEKIKGSFIFGSRKGNPWEGYGDIDKGIEDGE